jgi:hypothetical protein
MTSQEPKLAHLPKLVRMEPATEVTHHQIGARELVPLMQRATHARQPIKVSDDGNGDGDSYSPLTAENNRDAARRQLALGQTHLGKHWIFLWISLGLSGFFAFSCFPIFFLCFRGYWLFVYSFFLLFKIFIFYFELFQICTF